MKIVREAVVNTAIELLDEVGLEGLTMRKLAAALDVRAPSLYWHFPSKEALLDGMTEALLAPVGRNLADGLPWEEKLWRIAVELRSVLVSRRDASRVFAGTYVLGSNTLRVGSLMHSCLQDAGFEHRRASWGVFTLTHFIAGFAIEEQAFRNRPTDNTHLSLADTELLANYPLGAQLVAEITIESADERFAFGFNTHLAGWKNMLCDCSVPHRA